MRTIDVLNKHKSVTPSNWKEEAEYRKKNTRWLLYSAMISLKVKQRMVDIGMTQVVLADKLGCTQQHISMLLKGKTNLTLETIAKLEEALDFNILGEYLIPSGDYGNRNSCKPTLLNEPDDTSYGKEK